MGNSEQAKPQGPLSGVKILDLTSNISGPSATVILADLGAEVIKVERPVHGDDARGMGPYLGGHSAYFLAINRNKQSVVIDIRQKEGQELIRRLASQVDVVIENFRRGVLEKYQLDAQSLCKDNPQLIYCSLSAYGELGAESAKPGYDAVLQARTGIMSITGSREEEPARAGVSILDVGSGMWSAIAILSALYHRKQTGEGQVVGSSLFETGVFWMNYHVTAYQGNGKDPMPLGAAHAAFTPYGAYETSDDLLLLGISNDSLFQRLTQALGKPELAEDDRFVKNADRLAHRRELEGLIQEVLRTDTCASWLEKLEAKGVPCSRIQKVSQVLADPHVHLLNMLPAVDHPEAGAIRIPRLPIRLEKSPSDIHTGAPLLGEHTLEVLRRHGITEQEIEAYHNNGIIEYREEE